MSLVLYPEQLQEACRAFDEACRELTQRGSEFSRERLAAQILTAMAEGSRAPSELIMMLIQEPRPRYLH